MRVWRVPYPKFGAPDGLARTRRVAEALGVDLAGFGACGAVITGSNGKGSTAAMAAALLSASGRRTGLFTSPHMLSLNERFRVDNADISDAELDVHWARARAAAAASGLEAQLGGFEFLFLIAADWFAARGCDATIWEAGIGGRHDVTRLITPSRTALVSLDLEHTTLLGSTLEDIARDKLDAAAAGAIAFVGPSCTPQREAIERHCAARGVTPLWPVALAEAPLAGAHQRANAALALAIAEDIAGKRFGAGSISAAALRWPGRLELIAHEPETVIDVGHTPAAVAAAAAGFLELCGARRRVLVCGVSADKDAADIVAALAQHFPTIVCAQARHKGRAAGEIAALARRANPCAEISVAESVAAARAAAQRAAGPQGAILVAGGLFLAAEFKALHLGLDPAQLDFF